MPSDINSLKLAIQEAGGLAKPNRFKVTMTLPAELRGQFSTMGRDIEFLCESVSMPGKQITTLDYEFGYKKAIKIPTGFIEDDVTMVFNLTNNYLVKNALDRWMEIIIDPDSYLSSYKSEYSSTITIAQLDERDRPRYTVKLIGAYPVTLNAIEFDNGTTDASQKITAVFTYVRVIRELNNI